ncbi:Hint domain-containing protein [Aestuariibius sp. 2305UL40-4]|uniref:Hint domain-containing protein n=1 Tax=Aestuariibius violaceus TaxID=3234132 RepID=UPI00345E0A30
MATIVVYELNADPFDTEDVEVINSFTVDITDDDGTLEDPDGDGSPQFDVSSLPDFQGDSSDLGTFETYTGEVDGTPVTFTLIQFGTREYMIVTEGSVEVGDIIVGTNNGATVADPIDYVDLPDFVCFTAGSLIETPEGPRRIETLHPGDLVNVAEGPPRPVRWVGRRRLRSDDLRRNPHLRPVRIRADAFGCGLLRRDVIVSPQHRIATRSARAQLIFGVSDVLIPARFLIDGAGICVDQDATQADYVHIFFDRHELVEVEGLWTESFFPGDTAMDAMSDAILQELFELFPELAEDLGTYGQTAMRVVKAYEAKALGPGLHAYRPKGR